MVKIFGQKELQKLLEWAKVHSKSNKKGLRESRYGTLVDSGSGLGFIPKPEFLSLIQRKGFTSISLEILRLSFRGVMVLSDSIITPTQDGEPDL